MPPLSAREPITVPTATPVVSLPKLVLPAGLPIRLWLLLLKVPNTSGKPDESAFPATIVLLRLAVPVLSMPPANVALLAVIVLLLTVRVPRFRMPPPRLAMLVEIVLLVTVNVLPLSL